MTKHKSKKKSKFGLAPGTAVFTGVQKMDSIEIFVTQYNEDSCHELKCNSIQELKQMLSNTNDKIWVNIAGLHDEESIIEMGCGNDDFHNHFCLPRNRSSS
uniref:hypothetical protein n=1 Tax=Flavobacterium sp. TaxID=239 RepID=UPI004049D542